MSQKWTAAFIFFCASVSAGLIVSIPGESAELGPGPAACALSNPSLPGGSAFCRAVRSPPTLSPEAPHAYGQAAGSFCESAGVGGAPTSHYSFCGSAVYGYLSADGLMHVEIALQQEGLDLPSALAHAVLQGIPAWVPTFVDARGKAWAQVLEQSRKDFQTEIDQVAKNHSDLVTATQAYWQGTLASAVAKEMPDLDQLLTQIRDKVNPISTRLAGTGVTPSPLPAEIPILPSDLTASEPVRSAIQHLDEKGLSPLERWNRFEPIERANTLPSAEEDSEDRDALAGAYQRYVAPNGLVNGAILDGPTATIAQQLAPELRTAAETPEGHRVRHELNRALVAHAQADGDPELAQRSLGSAMLAMGADAAYSEQDFEAGDQLSRRAALVTDLVLGLIPGVSSLNDVAQILHGMATGYDFAGNRMKAGDYALRGLGAVLGALPFGGPLAEGAGATVKFGQALLRDSFRSGSAAIRASGDAALWGRATAPLREAIVPVVDAIGKFRSEGNAARGLVRLNSVEEGALEAAIRESPDDAVFLGKNLDSASDSFISALEKYGRAQKLTYGKMAVLSEFKDGASYFITNAKYEEYVVKQGILGAPDGLFVLTSGSADKLIEEAGGSAAAFERRLGSQMGSFEGKQLWRIDLDFKFSYEPKIPSGFQSTANEYFRYGGTTSGGLPEIIFRQLQKTEIKRATLLETLK